MTSEFDFFKNYNDLLIFETDLAQIVELIILFCESEGSLAELGAFAATDEIMKRLFVVIRERHWNENSFIKLGPLRRIENHVGRNAISVIADDDVGFKGHSAADIDKNKLIDILIDPLNARLEMVRKTTTLDHGLSGHVIKLIVGLVQEYGALTLGEIIETLKIFHIHKDKDDIRGYLLCSIAVRWLEIVSKGARDFYVQTASSHANGKDAATLYMKDGAKEANKGRRRFDIRQYWKEKDKLRFAAIQQVMKGMPLV